MIQIFTRGRSLHVRLAAGSQETWEFSTGFGREGERGGFSAGAPGCPRRASTPPMPTTSAMTRTGDGFSSRSGRLVGDYEVTDALTLRGRALRAESNNEFDGTPDETDNVQQSVSGELEWMPVDTWRSRLSIGETVDDSDSRDSRPATRLHHPA
ncbi:MAG: hypothetical protein U5L11_16135 [Arhodomonas sp.]|nr:hypothetical protein [Arhodomonas sp.]